MSCTMPSQALDSPRCTELYRPRCSRERYKERLPRPQGPGGGPNPQTWRGVDVRMSASKSRHTCHSRRLMSGTYLRLDRCRDEYGADWLLSLQPPKRLE